MSESMASSTRRRRNRARREFHVSSTLKSTTTSELDTQLVQHGGRARVHNSRSLPAVSASHVEFASESNPCSPERLSGSPVAAHQREPGCQRQASETHTGRDAHDHHHRAHRERQHVAPPGAGPRASGVPACALVWKQWLVNELAPVVSGQRERERGPWRTLAWVCAHSPAEPGHFGRHRPTIAVRCDHGLWLRARVRTDLAWLRHARWGDGVRRDRPARQWAASEVTAFDLGVGGAIAPPV